MAESGSQQVRDQLVECLARLTDQSGPLQGALGQLRAAARSGGWRPPPELDAQFRQIDRDLAGLQSSGRRVAKQLGRVEGLMHTSSLLTSSLEIDQVLEGVMDTAIELTNAERAFLVLKGENGELEFRAARNWDRETLAEYEGSRSVIQSALESGEPVLTVNAQGDSRFQGNESVLVNDLRSIICIPLKLRDEVTGVFYADNRLEQGVFDEDSVELAATFASHAAVAIENAKHFQRVRDDLAKAEREVRRLKVEIDDQRVAQELDEVTESDYFKRISSLAKDLRSRKGAD